MQDFFDQAVDVGRGLTRKLGDRLLNPSQDAIRVGSRVALAHQAHGDSQVQRALNLRRNAIVKGLDADVEVGVETQSMTQQDVGQVALVEHKVHHAAQICPQLLCGVGLAGSQADALDAKSQLAEHLFE